jgi:hypothetical protein
VLWWPRRIHHSIGWRQTRRLRRHFAALSASLSEESLLRSAQPSERDAQILAEISLEKADFLDYRRSKQRLSFINIKSGLKRPADREGDYQQSVISSHFTSNLINGTYWKVMNYRFKPTRAAFGLPHSPHKYIDAFQY